MPDICENVPKKDLIELCKKTGESSYKRHAFWPACRKTCDEAMEGKIDYTSSLKLQYVIYIYGGENMYLDVIIEYYLFLYIH